MLKGKTSTGYAFTIDDDAKDDYDLMNAFSKLQNGQTEVLDEAVELLLGTKQRDKLREHCRGKSGRVLASKVIKELEEIINIIGKSDEPVKN